MKKFLVFFLILWGSPALAADIEFDRTFTQQMFRDFSEEAGTLILYRAVGPMAPLGTTGFTLGVELTATDIHEDRDYWKKAVEGQDPSSYLVNSRLRFQKGLPWDLDVGVVVGTVLDPSIPYLGGEIRYAILKGDALLPSLSVRGSYSQTLGVDQLDFKTYGLDLSVSKGFGVGIKVIPYAGIGQYWFSSKPQDLTTGLNLSKEEFSKTRGYIGAQLQMAFLSFTAEVDYVTVPSLSLLLGIGF